MKTNLTPKTCISEMSKFYLEVFQESKLLVNIKEHVLVPEHLVLVDAENKTLPGRYTVKKTQVHRIHFLLAHSHFISCKQVLLSVGDQFPATRILINGKFMEPQIDAVTNDNLIINVDREPFLISWLPILLRLTALGLFLTWRI
ncbi:DNA-directed RNA polymerases II and IV subunit 5A [Spatholobus suberectus]|nr:DNA-directed RNA polymerases II and IV subunit 5A [Spatholobus suberectus]